MWVTHRQGRFTPKLDHSRIQAEMVALQRKTGTEALWFEFESTTSGSHPIYDEGSLEGSRDWSDTPFWMPVIDAIREEGEQRFTQQGQYSTDRIHLVISYAQMTRSPITDPEDTERHLLDRFVYEGVVFSPTSWLKRGQIRGLDIVYGVDAAEVDPDELVYDPDFQQWARRPPETP
jgi:hypothetical protein